MGLVGTKKSSMIYKILRFIGAIITALIFNLGVNVIHIYFFGGTAHVLANLSWSNWFSFDTIRGFYLPIAWTILYLIGAGLVWMVRGSKIIAAIPIYIFITGGVISSFKQLFLEPVEMIVDDIGLGFWYYFGAVITFLFIIVTYLLCSIFMLMKQDVE